MSYRISIKRERFKFSCAHMTVFPDGTKERLHGHNYVLSLSLELQDISFKKMVDFAILKNAMKALCLEWKERTFIAQCNPFYEEIVNSADELEFKLCGKRYVIPKEDCLLLPIDNAAVEPLVEYALEWLTSRLAPVLNDAPVLSMTVTIDENPGQGASATKVFS